jgi:hypothetical protein
MEGRKEKKRNSYFSLQLYLQVEPSFSFMVAAEDPPIKATFTFFRSSCNNSFISEATDYMTQDETQKKQERKRRR